MKQTAYLDEIPMDEGSFVTGSRGEHPVERLRRLIRKTERYIDHSPGESELMKKVLCDLEGVLERTDYLL